jgi:bifunctional non-homologous end joining protein LigD
LDMRGLKAMDRSLWPGHEPAIAIGSAEDLVLAAQFDVFELHTWGSTAASITQPDRMVLDLDPGKTVPWPEVRKAALLVKAMLEELKLKSWVKTTGGKGLHIYVPLRPEFGYAEVKAFARAIVEHLAKALPQMFVAISGERARAGRVFIDYLRNGWVQTTAEAFSARARPGVGVSMPLRWEELDDVQSGDAWNIRTACERMDNWKSHPWADYWKSRQRLETAMKRLGYAQQSKRS